MLLCVINVDFDIKTDKYCGLCANTFWTKSKRRKLQFAPPPFPTLFTLKIMQNK